MIVGGVVAFFAVGFWFQGVGYVKSGECIESCAPTAYAVPIVLVVIAVTMFVVGWRRMRR
jgi:hypothetical protein